jgi:hypothetical protein
MANRRITDLQEIAGTSLAEQDLFTVVQVGEVDPTLKNKKLTISGAKQYFNSYYLSLAGGVVSGNTTFNQNLIVSGLTTTSGLTVINQALVSGLIVQNNATISGTISGLTLTGTNLQGTNINGVTVTATTVTGVSGQFASGFFNFLSVTSTGKAGFGTATPIATVDVAGNYTQNITSVAALDLDLSTSNYFTKTINANSTFTVSNTPSSRAYSFTLELTHTSGTITWFSGLEWPGGIAPTLTTGKTHLFMFVTDDGGSRWRGSSLINYTN